MLFDLDEAAFSREIMTRAERSIVAADSTKFGLCAPIRIAEPDAFDCLVTDAPPPPQLAAYFAGASVEVVVAEAAGQTHQ